MKPRRSSKVLEKPNKEVKGSLVLISGTENPTALRYLLGSAKFGGGESWKSKKFVHLLALKEQFRTGYRDSWKGWDKEHYRKLKKQ